MLHIGKLGATTGTPVSRHLIHGAGLVHLYDAFTQPVIGWQGALQYCTSILILS